LRQPPPLAKGNMLGRYRIEEKLGQGGMGVVYRAYDDQLHREVAIKMLSSDLASDPRRRQRFLVEARAASALSHPNICTLHDIGEHQGQVFLVMEHLGGKTLAERLKQGPLPLKETLEIAVQLADALAAAHNSGIIHRDLKPGNVMLTKGGVKLLDFGLAKLTEKTAGELGETETLGAQVPATQEGTIAGTVAYMSPEQAQGKPVDARSDIFSFGSVLYEMATGVRPFQGDTNLSVLSAILQKEPEPVSAIRHDIPADLERIISRCLKKDVERRFQHMGDVRVALLEFKEDSESGVTAAPPARRPAWPPMRKALIAGVILAILAAGGLLWWRLWPVRTPFQRIELQRLTTSGDAGEAAISPDGKYLARTSVHGEEQAIWLRQLKTGSEIQAVPPIQTKFSGLQFSRDGEYLYYAQSKGANEAALYRVPSLGGPAQLVLDKVTKRVAVSPDERRFAYLSGGPDKRMSITVAGPNPADRQTILTRSEPDFLRYQLSWSPDAKLLALPIGSSDDRFWQIESVLIVPLNGTAPAILSPVKWGMVWSAEWLANGQGLLVNGSANGSSLQFWFVPYPKGQPRRVTNDANGYWGVSTTADSTVFVTVQRDELGEMWTTAPRGGMPSQLTRTSPNAEGRGGIAWTPDGRLVYSSRALGDEDLWIANADGTNPKRLTFGGVAIAPEVAPDGRTIYFGSERSGACHIWRMDMDGNNASQVTHGHGEQCAAATPDGKWLLYESFSLAGPPSIWKMALPSGTPVRLGDLKSASGPVVSPDGQWFSLNYEDQRFEPPTGVGIMRLDGTGFKPLDIPPTGERRWSPDGKALYFAKTQQGTDNVWKLPLAGGAPVRVTNFSSGSIGSLVVSRDERLAFRHFNSISDVVLVRSVQ